MTSTLSWGILLPVILEIVQILLFLFLILFLLRRMRLLKVPFGGMEISEVLLCSSFILGTLLLAASDTESLFKAYKTYQGVDSSTVANTVVKFSQLFLVGLAAEAVFVMVSYLVLQLFAGPNRLLKELEEGNLPISILAAFMVLGINLAVLSMARQIFEWMTPVYVHFR